MSGFISLDNQDRIAAKSAQVKKYIGDNFNRERISFHYNFLQNNRLFEICLIVFIGLCAIAGLFYISDVDNKSPGAQFLMVLLILLLILGFLVIVYVIFKRRIRHWIDFETVKRRRERPSKKKETKGDSITNVNVSVNSTPTTPATPYDKRIGVSPGEFKFLAAKNYLQKKYNAPYNEITGISGPDQTLQFWVKFADIESTARRKPTINVPLEYASTMEDKQIMKESGHKISQEYRVEYI